MPFSVLYAHQQLLAYFTVYIPKSGTGLASFEQVEI